jgi:hypothetical protein
MDRVTRNREDSGNRLNRIMLSSFCLRMIAAQTLRVCRELAARMFGDVVMDVVVGASISLSPDKFPGALPDVRLVSGSACSLPLDGRLAIVLKYLLAKQAITEITPGHRE